ncbi:MAG: hypothetical protein PHW82_12485 [Bacteroidales bacterium]|nr:hypothetical protein [Bacteroidales bacterium]
MILYQHWYNTIINVTILDIIFLIVILAIAFLYAKSVSDKKSAQAPYYKYFTNALVVKILAGIVFAVITMLFYPGDTFEYFKIINSLNKLLVLDPSKYFDILFQGNQPEFWSYFTVKTGYPANYMWRDPTSIFVARVYSPLMLLTSGSFLISTVIASIVGFSGLWKLFQMFSEIYPGLERKFAIAILYFPSVLFWSSGILKDTITISAIGWIMYCFYKFAILRKFKLKYIITIVIASFLIIKIKSYIFAALVPGLFIWFFFGQLKAIKSGFIKFIVAPFLIIVVLFGFSLIMSGISDAMQQYGDVDTAIQYAQVVQQDLTRAEQYGENYYDIGKFEATPLGILKKAPIAIVSGIFRPFIWEASSPFILLAGLESLFLMLFLAYCIFKTGLIQFFRNIFKDPMLIFAFSFIIIFGFGVGLASANFGALVRYKIPLLPLFVAGLIVLAQKFKTKKSQKTLNINTN